MTRAHVKLLTRRGCGLCAQVYQRLADLAAELDFELSSTDVDVAAYLISVFIESVMDDFVLYRRSEGEFFPDDRVIETASEFVIRCVMGRID